MATKSPRQDLAARPRPNGALNAGLHSPSRRHIAALAVPLLAGAAALGAGWGRALAGDSLYGRVTEVKAANVVVLDYGAGQYIVRLIGVEPPREGRSAAAAVDFVRRMVLGKNARLRFERRLPSGEMLGRLGTDDPAIGIKDVGLELVRAGLARRSPDYDYKYGELAVAERDAQQAQRGLWSPAQR